MNKLALPSSPKLQFRAFFVTTDPGRPDDPTNVFTTVAP